MQIRRRIYNKETGKRTEHFDKVTLVQAKGSTVLVRLQNGDVIKRKGKDIIEA